MTDEDYYRQEDIKMFIMVLSMAIFFIAIGYYIHCIVDCMEKAKIERQKAGIISYLEEKNEFPTINSIVAPDCCLYPMAPISPKKGQIRAIVTAYNPTVEQCDSDPTIMASGKKVYENAIACPRYLDFGDIIEIDNKIYICEDRMAKKNDGNFDILMFSEEKARQWGKQIKDIGIY